MNILITGASRGIGAAALVALKAAGHRVIGHSSQGSPLLIAGDEQRAALAGRSDNAVARPFKSVERGRANAPAGAGDEDVHEPRLARIA